MKSQGRVAWSGNVTGATNASPIVITTDASHQLVSGDQVVIAGVGGNTNANGTFVVTVVDTTHFSLNSSTGNAPYTSGGTWTTDTINATNADAVLTWAARTGAAHSVDVVRWSYSAAPTGGRLTIKDGATIIEDVDITAAGPGFLPYSRTGHTNNAFEVRLYAGGSGVVGKLSAGHAVGFGF